MRKNKIIKLLAAIASAAMAAATLVVPASADGAQNLLTPANTESAETIELSSGSYIIPDDGAHIQATTSTEGAPLYRITGNVTLDANGWTIQNYNGYAVEIASGATLTLVDSYGYGPYIGKDSGIKVDTGAALVVNKGGFWDSDYGIYVDGGTVTVNDTSMKGIKAGIKAVNGATVNVTGGEVLDQNSDPAYAIDAENSTVNVSGGTVFIDTASTKTNCFAIKAVNSDVNISGGTVKNESSTGGAMDISGGTLTISGGSISDGVIVTSGSPAVNVTDGTFGSDSLRFLEAYAPGKYVSTSEGYGIAHSISTISSAAELAAFRDAVNGGNSYSGAIVNLAADITLSGDWTPVGTEANPFSGTFNGGGHTISGLSINNSLNDQGLFGYCDSNAGISNLTISAPSVSAGSNVGAVAGHFDGKISNVAVTGGTVSGTMNVGGLIGIGKNSVTGTSLRNSGAVTGTATNIGGIIGSANGTTQNDRGQFTDCINTGAVICTCKDGSQKIEGSGAQTGNALGGIAGYSYLINFNECANTGSVTAEYDADNTRFSTFVGGLIGLSGFCNLTDVYNTGSISEQRQKSSSSYAGGLVGYAKYSTKIDRCYNAGSVSVYKSDAKSGAIIGWAQSNNTVDNCYYLEGLELAGAKTGSSGLTEYTTEEVTEDQLRSGEIAHKLSLKSDVWGQLIGTHLSPVFYNGESEEESSKPVYMATIMAADGILEQEDPQYVNAGGYFTQPEAPEEEGLNFRYWGIVGTGEAYDFTKPVTSDVTLTPLGVWSTLDNIDNTGKTSRPGTGIYADEKATGFVTDITSTAGQQTISRITWYVTSDGVTKHTSLEKNMTLSGGAEVKIALIIDGLNDPEAVVTAVTE